MFQFTRLLQTSLCIQLAAVGNPGIITCLSTPPGFSQTSTPFILLTPRHPPCALSRLVIEIPNSELASQRLCDIRRHNQTISKPIQTSFIRKVIHLTISHVSWLSFEHLPHGQDSPVGQLQRILFRIHSQITLFTLLCGHRSELRSEIRKMRWLALWT